MKRRLSEAELLDQAIDKARSIYPGKGERTLVCFAAQLLAERAAKLRTGKPADESEADRYYRAAVRAMHRVKKLPNEVAA